MAAEKVLAFGIVLCLVSSACLFVSLLTDNWFVIDATKYNTHCREDKLLEQLYPWNTIDSERNVEKEVEDDVTYSGEENATTPQISLGNRTRNWSYNFTDRTYNDWPGLPIMSATFGVKPVPLLQRIRRLNGRRKASRKLHGLKHIQNTPDVYSRVRRNADNLASKENIANKNGKLEQKVEAWNRLVRDLEFNLFGFGGRDVSFNRRKHMEPSGARNNECADEMKKSIKRGNVTTRCTFKAPDCRKRQFSTATGLWQTCLSNDGSTFLSTILENGNITRCAPVRYANLKKHNLPAGLKAKEVEEVYQEEWKTLHLRRILTSFLCMAAPVQIFGLILVIGGWISQRGFIIYTGGLVLVMSGTFQLLAIGTSILLFDVELHRNPVEVYRFPEGVTEEFGRSAQALWVSAGSAIVAGVLCAISTTLSPLSAPRNNKFVNGTVTAHVSRSNEPPTNHSERPVDLVVNITSAEPYVELKTAPLQHQSYSLDNSRTELDTLPVPAPRRKELRRQSKTYSAPNLCDSPKSPHAGTGRGRSVTRRTRPVSPLATVRTPQAALKGNKDDTSDSGDQDEPCPSRDKSPTYVECSAETEHSVGHLLPGPVILNTRSHILRQGLPYSQSLDVPQRSYDYKTGLSCQTTVDISQRLRHARYARRTSHSCEETVAKVRKILRGASLDEERRTRSLPRPTMRHTPLSELSGGSGPNVLKDHCELFLQRHGLRGVSSEHGTPSRGRPGALALVGRHNSDTGTILPRSVHPAVARWWQDGGRWSRSLDEGRKVSCSLTRDSTRSRILAREGTLDSVRECAESGDSSPSEKGSTQDLEQNET